MKSVNGANICRNLSYLLFVTTLPVWGKAILGI